MASVFTKIVSGEIPSYKVAETENYLAFLDISPIAKGHTLVIPKKEVDYLYDLEEETYIGLQLFAKHVAEGLKKATNCKRVGVAVEGFEVPHAHIHLIPLDSGKDFNFSNRQKMTEEEMVKICMEIREAI